MKRWVALFGMVVLIRGGALASDQMPVRAFLESLDQEQRSQAVYPLAEAHREQWHYLPATMWSRAGISLGELNQAQKGLLFQALEKSLSETGYDKARRIIDLEDVLAEASGNAEFRDSKKYYAAFYGNPEVDAVWSWSFEGHHLSLNFTISEGKTSIVPRFMGANPAMIQSGPRKGQRTLANEQDLGLELINSMNEAQRKEALFRAEAYRDIITTNESQVEPL
jgi:hypothetical protein